MLRRQLEYSHAHKALPFPPVFSLFLREVPPIHAGIPPHQLSFKDHPVPTRQVFRDYVVIARYRSLSESTMNKNRHPVRRGGCF